MTQLSPYTILGDQVSSFLREMQKNERTGLSKTFEDSTIEFRKSVSEFVNKAGRPRSERMKTAFGEPPDSSKFNEFFSSVRNDLSIAKNQTDIMRAHSLLAFNSLSSELLLMRHKVGYLESKARTLDLYSSDSDPNVLVFRENFITDDYLNPNAVNGSVASVLSDSYLTLGRQFSSQMVTLNPSVEIEEDLSNGVYGNFLELSRTAPYNYSSIEEEEPEFLCEELVMHDLRAVLDNNPTSWFEYSAFKITGRGSFSNSANRTEPKPSEHKYYDDFVGAEVNWSKGPFNLENRKESDSLGYGDQLHLTLLFSLEEESVINNLSITPYGMRENANYPFCVSKIETSLDGDEWEILDREEMWVGTNVSARSMAAVPNYFVNEASVSFPPKRAMYVRVLIRQPFTYQVDIGRIFYVDPETGERKEGPVPSVSNIFDQFHPSRKLNKDHRQEREYVPALRWGIGIRDISISHINYDTSSTMISKPIDFPGIIDRVSIDADLFIPSDFGEEAEWIKFLISGDKGSTWTEISRVTDNFMGLPEVVVFNDPRPIGFREDGAAYISTDSDVSSIMVKTIITRPSDVPWSTPMVRSYSLRVRMR